MDDTYLDVATAGTELPGVSLFEENPLTPKPLRQEGANLLLPAGGDLIDADPLALTTLETVRPDWAGPLLPEANARVESAVLGNGLDALTGQRWVSDRSQNSFTFHGSAQDDTLFLQTNANNLLEFSTDGIQFEQVDGLTLSSTTQIKVDLLGGNDTLTILDDALITVGSLSLNAETIAVGAGAIINSANEVELLAIATQQTILPQASQPITAAALANISLAANSQINATEVLLQAQAQSSLLIDEGTGVDTQARANINLAGQITSRGNITLRSDVDHTVELKTIPDDSLIDLTTTFESVAAIDLAAAALTAQTGTVQLSATTTGRVNATAQRGNAQNNAIETATVRIGDAASDKTVIEALGIDITAKTETEYTAVGAQAANQVMGKTRTEVVNANLTAAASGISLAAIDESRLTANTTRRQIDLDAIAAQTSRLALAASTAQNELDREVVTSLVNTQVAVDNGELKLAADKAVQMQASADVAAVTASDTLKPKFSLSGGGTFAANAVLGSVNAFISGSGIETTGTGDVSVIAQDRSTVNAVAEAGTLSTGGAGSVAGGAIAFNALGWEINNFFSRSLDTLLGTTIGDVEQPSTVQAYLTDSTAAVAGALSLLATSEARLNSTVSNVAKSTASALSKANGIGVSGILSGNKVSRSANAYIHNPSVAAGSAIAVGGKLTVSANDNTGVFSNSKIITSQITTNTGGVDLINDKLATAGTLVAPTTYNTAALDASNSTQTLNFGDTVSLSLGFNDALGKPGRTYTYLGESGYTIDLLQEDYANLDLWKEQLATQVQNGGLNLSKSNSVALGGMVVRNEVRGGATAYIKAATVSAAAVEVSATEQAIIRAIADATAESSGGSAFGTGQSIAANGTIAVNTVLSDAIAYIEDAQVVTTGDIAVQAKNTAQIEAETKSAINTGADAYGLILAFNTLGYDAQNLLFGTFDALLGFASSNSIFGNQNPAKVSAYIRKSEISAAGDVTVTADALAEIGARTSNNATAAGAALFGASAMITSGVLASNKVSAKATAFVDNGAGSASPADVKVAGELVVTALDESAIDATTNMTAAASKKNDLGLGIVNDLFNTLTGDYQYTTNSGIQTLKFGDQVRLDNVDHKTDDPPTSIAQGDWIELSSDIGNGIQGAVYEYIGNSNISGTGLLGKIDFDQDADFSDATNWRLIQGKPGSVYQYMGDGVAGGVNDNRDLATEDYTNFALWKELSENNVIPGSISTAVLKDNKLDTGSSQSFYGVVARNDVEADVLAYLDQVVLSAPAGGGPTKIIVAATDAIELSATDTSVISSNSESKGGVLTNNQLRGHSDAYITNSQLQQSGNVGEISVTADNVSKLNATSLTASKGTESVGAVVSFNSIGWEASNVIFQAVDALLGTAALTQEDPARAQAYIEDSVVIADGDVRVLANASALLNATTSNEQASTPTNSFLINKAYGNKAMSAGGMLASNKVSSDAQAWIDYSDGYAGPRTITAGGAVEVKAQDEASIIADSRLAVEAISTNNLDALTDVAIALSGDDYDFTTASGTQSLSNGTRVRLANNYRPNQNFGDGGAVYKYVGPDTSVDLGSENFNNQARWQKVTLGVEDLGLNIGNLSASPARAYGGLVVVNDVRSNVDARLANSLVNAGAVSVDALENASIQAFAESSIEASGGSAFKALGTGKVFAANGLIATNIVQAEVDALLADSSVTTDRTGTTGDVAVSAMNTSGVDATINAAMVSGEDAFGAVVALNTLGWKASNVLFATIDAILGDPLISQALGQEVGANTTAKIVNSELKAAGTVSTVADSAARMNATVSNAASSAASALFDASGQAAGGVIASNKVSSSAEAVIEQSDPAVSSQIAAGEEVVISAANTAEINANVKLVSSSVTTNDGGVSVVQERVNDSLAVDFVSTEGKRDLEFGDRIRLADDYDSSLGNPGSVYQFMGATASGFGRDLSNEDYTDLGFWKEVTETQLFPSGANLDNSDSTAVGGLVVLNDMRSKVNARLENVLVTARSVDIDAIENASVRAIADSTAISSGGNIFDGQGESLAVNGVIATNGVLSEAQAFINNSDITTTVDDVAVDAKNSSTIDAQTLSATQSGANGVGVTLAFNQVGWDSQNWLFNTVDTLLGDPLIANAFGNQKPALVQAYIRDSNLDVAGGIDLSAVSEASVDAVVTNEAESAAYSFGSGDGAAGLAVGVAISQNLVNSDARAFIDNPSGQAANIKSNLTARSGDVTILAQDDASIVSNSKLAAISSTVNDAGLTLLAQFVDQLAKEYQFTERSGIQQVAKGDQVLIDDVDYNSATSNPNQIVNGDRVEIDFDLADGSATAGQVFEYIDTTPLGNSPNLDNLGVNSYNNTALWRDITVGHGVYQFIADTPATIDLGQEDFSNRDRWREISSVDPREVIPGLSFNLTDSDSSAFGGLVVRNDVRSNVESSIDNATVTAAGDVKLNALESATIFARDESTVTSSGGSTFGGGTSLAVNGVIVTNFVLSAANAKITDSVIDTEALSGGTNNGSVSVNAENTSKIDATVNSTIDSNGASIGAVLAFNTIGIESQNFLFNTVDALVGTNIASARPAETQALIENTEVKAAGDLSVTATSDAQINAAIENAAKSITATIGDGEDDTGTIAVGAVVALNKINTQVRADIDNTQAPASIVRSQRGDIRVKSANTSAIASDVAASALAVAIDLGSNKTRSITVGLSISRNDVRNDMEATIKKAGDNNNPVEAKAGDIVVSADEKAKITSTSVATAIGVAASASEDALAFSGGGATALNTILGKANAYLEGAAVKAGGAGKGTLSLLATNDAEIDSTVGVTAVSVALAGGKTAVAAAIGFSFASNLIGWSSPTTEDHQEVMAYAKDTDITANNGITISAQSDASIDAEVSATTVAIAASTKTTGGLTAGGLTTFNKISTDVKAYIDGDSGTSAINTTNGDISLTATDTAKITADAQAIAVSASLSGKTAGALAIGLSLAENYVNNQVAAYLNQVNALTGGGDVTIAATDANATSGDTTSISAKAIAVAVSAAIGGGTGFTLSGGGAVSTNTILNKLNAYIADSNLGSATDSNKVSAVDLDANSAAKIDATIGAVAASVTFGGKAGVGVALGVSVARNFIGWEANANTNATYETGTGLPQGETLSRGQTVKITEGARAGDVYRYVGSDQTQPIDLSTQDYSDRRLWEQVNLTSSAAQVRAYSDNSSIHANSALTADAVAKQNIEAIVVAGAVAIAGGGKAGVGASGAGVYTENRIQTEVKAYVEGDGASGITAGNIGLNATDTAKIKADAGAASIAAGLGGKAGVGVSLGISLATNEINNDVAAYISNADQGVTTTLGGVQIGVKENADISARALAASLAAGFAGKAGIAVSGAGAWARNIILTDANAYIFNSEVDSNAGVALDARSASKIEAKILAASAAIGAGAVGVGASIGVAIAENQIGNRDDAAEVQAYLNKAAVNARNGALTLNAQGQQSIEALVISGSVAIAAGGGGVGLSGSGVSATNLIAAHIKAFIEGDDNNSDPQVRGIQADSLAVVAQDSSSILADAGAASLAAAFAGSAAVSFSIGASIANNEIRNEVEAFIKDATAVNARNNNILIQATAQEDTNQISRDYNSSTDGTVTLKNGDKVANNGRVYRFLGQGGSTNLATTDYSDETLWTVVSSITAVSAAASASAAISGIAGIALSGAGASATNTILTKTNAYVENSALQSGGDIALNAKNTATIDALIVSASLALGGAGGTGVGASLGVSLARNIIGAESDPTIGSTYTTANPDGAQKIEQGQTVKIAGGVRGGEVYEYIGTKSLNKPSTPGSGPTQNWLLGQDYGNTQLWKRVDLMDSPAQVQAYVRDSSLQTQGTLTQRALSAQAINSQVLAASAAVSAGLASVSISDAGASTENRIATQVKAFIDGDGATGIRAAAIDLAAEDQSTITADTAANSIAASFAKFGVALSVGVALAQNSVKNEVAATIANASNTRAFNGGINLAATENAEIDARAVAASFAGATLAGISGAGVKSTNEISNTTQAGISDSTLVQASRGVRATADNTSTITANLPSISASGGLAAASGAVVISENIVTNTTRTYLDNARLSAQAGNVTLAATSDETVQADTLAIALAAAIVSAATAVTKATSKINGITESYISGPQTEISALSGDVQVISASSAEAKATLKGGSAGTVSVSEMTGESIISADTKAYVTENAKIAARNLLVQTFSPNSQSPQRSTRQANTTVEVGNAGFVSTAKTQAIATIDGAVEAFIDSGAEINTDLGSTVVQAHSQSDASAIAKGGSGGGVAISLFEAKATIGSQAKDTARKGSTRAYIGEAVMLTTNDLTVSAEATNNASNDLFTLGIGILAGGAGAKSTTRADADTESYVGRRPQATSAVSPAIINATGNVAVTAQSAQSAKSNVDGGGGGLVGGGDLNAETKLLGTTQAFLGTGTQVLTANNIDINAASLGAIATTNVSLGIGGAVAVGGSKATAASRPIVNAFLDDNVTIGRANALPNETVRGDLSVIARGQAEADAQARANGGGGVNVGIPEAIATVEPEVYASLGSGSDINVGGSVIAKADLVQQTAGALPSNVIERVNTQTAATNPSSLEFNFPVSEGTVVTYQKPDGQAAIGGLTDGREYNVLEVEKDKTIRLGNVIESNTVDALTDTITFSAPHNFLPGDEVIYNSNGGLSIIEAWQTQLPTTDPRYVSPDNRFFVRGVPIDVSQPINLTRDNSNLDPFSIRLARTRAEALATDASLLKSFEAADVTNNTLTIAGHNFVNGQAVTYRAAAANQFVMDAVDPTLTTETFTLKDGTQQTATVIDRTDDGKAIHTDNNRIYLPNHGFASGDAVIYRNTDSGADVGGLIAGTTYFVIRRNDNEISLANTLDEAVGRPGNDGGTPDDTTDDTPAITITPKALAPITTAADLAGIHTLERSLGNLQNEQTYYVVNADQSQGTFQLAAQRNGPSLAITAANRGGIHRIGTLGVDLTETTPQPGSQKQSLYVPLTSQPVGNHRFLGSGGVALSTLSPQPGDGVSSALAAGGSGGGIDVNVPSGRVNATYTVKVDIEAASVVAGQDVKFAAKSAMDVTTSANTGSGGVVAVGEAHADTLLGQSKVATTQTDIGKNVQIIAGDNVSLTSESNSSVGASAKSVGGGPIAGRIAETTAKLNYQTKTIVDENANIAAGDVLNIETTSTANGRTSSETYSVGVGAGADSDDTNGDRGVDIDAVTQVEVNNNANLEASAVRLNAEVTKIDTSAFAKATAYSPILFGVATAFGRAKVDVNSAANVLLSGADTRITGTEGVDITARQQGIRVDRNARHLAVALIPPQNAFAEGTVDLDAQVNADPGLVVTAGAREDTRITETNLVNGQTQGLKNSDGTDKVNPALALFVDASIDNPALTFPGNSGSGGSLFKDSDILWDANVTILGGTGDAPELVIDETGRILTANNVTVKDDRNDAVSLSENDVISDGDYFVEVANGGRQADVLFTADNLIKNETLNGNGTPDWPLFEFRNGFDQVTILDHSDQEMHVVEIDPINRSDDLPLVQLESAVGGTRSSTTLEFDLVRSYAATLIDIQKIQRDRTNSIRSDRDIVIDGNIINPVGFTRILNTDGNILASAPTAWIETSALDIEALNGSVGLNDANRVNVALVRGVDLGDVRDPDDDAPRPTTLYGTAQNDVYLNLKGIDRIPQGASLQEPFVVSIDAIESRAGDVNLLLQDSEHQTGAGQVGGVRVHVPTESPKFDQVLNSHFRPDSDAQRAIDPAVLAGETVTLIDSTYRFEPKNQLLPRELSVFGNTGLDIYEADMFDTIAPESAGLLANQDITIRHNSDQTVIDLDGFTNLLPSNNQSDLLTATGLGLLDVVTSGTINLTEVAGTLNVGQARSRKGDVILTVRDSENGDFENLRVDNNLDVDTEILAEMGEVILRAGDDLLLTDAAKVQAAKTVTIEGDFDNQDVDGSIIDLRGLITAQAPDTAQPAVNIVTDTDDDIVSLTNVQAGSPTQVSTLQGEDLIQVGSLATTLLSLSNRNGTLNRIGDLLRVDGGEGSDKLQLDETGDTAENSGVLSSTRLIGLGMASVDADQKRINQTKGIAYQGLEDLSLELGSNSDRLVIDSTHSGATTVDTADGNDIIDLGSNPVLDGEGRLQTDADNKIVSGGSVDNISGSLTLTGGSGLDPDATPGTDPQNKDTLNIDERADLDGNVGANAGLIAATGDGRAQVTGLDMAGNVVYDQFEILNVDLSEFEDALTIEDNTDAGETTVKAGAGNDAVMVNLRSPIDEAIFVANGETGNDTIDAEGSTVGVVLNGNEGDDTVLGGSANDLMGGGSGGDAIDGNAGQDEIYGDSTYAEKATDATYDGYQFLGDAMSADPSTRPQPVEDALPGNDNIQGGAGEDTIYAEAGDDSVVGGSAEAGAADGRDYIYGGAGDDVIAGDNATITNGDITLNDSANGDTDIIFGDGGEIIRREGDQEQLLTARLAQSDGNDNIAGDVGEDILFGDNGRVVLSETAQPLRIETVNPTVGGSDSIQGNADDDKILGGAAGDTLQGNEGEDIILGDHGRFAYLFEGTTVTDVVDGEFTEVDVSADADPTTLDEITTTDATEGGDDRILGGTGNDLVFGGTGGDIIDGDEGQAEGAIADGADDILLGDHGAYYTALPQEQHYRSIETSAADGGGNDIIRGNQGDDKILGQQGDDQLFGQGGEDDITGGHNVRDGADGSDVIEGGADADVILGDNGLITRTIQGDGSPERYPAPFADVIRDVVRFDDAEAVAQASGQSTEATHGDDLIKGGEGDDIAHGQRGDDTVEGGNGDDELYGELGNDIMDGGNGNDTILGDTGFIIRAFNPDGTPRLNTNGSWHRDVILTEVGRITRNNSVDEDFAEQSSEDDIWLLTSGNRVLSVELESPGNDVIAGGDGEDVIFGQLGEDVISGGGDRDYIEGNAGDDTIEGDGGDDIIIGDDGANLAAFETDSPVVRRGFHLIDADDGTDTAVGDFGTVVLPHLFIQPKTLDSIFPVLGTTPELGSSRNNIPPIGGLRQTDGSELSVLASIIPDIGGHTGQQDGQHSLFSGNDTITDSSGKNTIIGDNYINIAPLRTNDSDINAELDELMREIYQVSYGLHDLELERLNRNPSAPPEFRIGNDNITGGSDADWITGDNRFFFGPFLTPEASESTAVLITDLHEALSTFEQSLYRQIDAFDPATETTTKVPGELIIGNDTLQGLGGDDRIVGDDQYLFAPVLESFPYRRRSFWNYGRGRDTTGRSQKLQDFNLTVSNDTVQGNDGKDMIVGDYATTILPVFESLPSDRLSQQRLGTAIDGLVSDIEQLLRDLSQEDYGIRFANRTHSHELNALNDSLSGNDGDDLIVGDNASLRLPIIGEQPEFSLGLTSDRFNVEDEAYNFQHKLPRQVETAFRSPSATLNLNNDVITGDAGADILFGLSGIDEITGGSDDDFLVGGRGDDILDPGTGSNTVRRTNTSSTDIEDTLSPAIDDQLESWISPASQQYLNELILNRSRFALRDDVDGQAGS